MPVRRSSLFAGVLLAAVASAAARADPPPRTPDFHAVARLAGFEQPIEIRQSGLKRRVDVATDAVVQSYIADRGKGMLMVLTAAGRRRLALVFPFGADAADTPLPTEISDFPNQAGLTQIGASHAAGRPCALYRYVGLNGKRGVVCATDDGVVLQLTPDGRPTPLFEVETLDYAPQNPRWFLPPPEYQIAVLPGIGGIAKLPPAPSTPSVDGGGPHP
jgi:hypothetical protein